jgi:hypothetical protein
MAVQTNFASTSVNSAQLHKKKRDVIIFNLTVPGTVLIISAAEPGPHQNIIFILFYYALYNGDP